jgi:archaellum biogenesis protein FlaJ (TadC family)
MRYYLAKPQEDGVHAQGISSERTKWLMYKTILSCLLGSTVHIVLGNAGHLFPHLNCCLASARFLFHLYLYLAVFYIHTADHEERNY